MASCCGRSACRADGDRVEQVHMHAFVLMLIRAFTGDRLCKSQVLYHVWTD